MVRKICIKGKGRYAGRILTIIGLFAAMIAVLCVSDSDSSAESGVDFTVDVYYTGTISGESNFLITGTYLLSSGPMLYEGDLVLSEYVMRADTGDRFIPVHSSYFGTKYHVTGIGDGSPIVGSFSSLTLSSSITDIRPYAFAGSVLSDIEFPSSVRSLGYRAFMNCNNLVEITIPDTIMNIGDDCFKGCRSLNTVHLGNIIFMGEGVFQDCTELISVEFPSSLNYVRQNTFSGCTNLKHVTFSGVLKYVAAYSFYKCSSLEGINLPDDVTRIEMQSFYECTSLKSIKIPNKTETLDEKSFYGCSSLSKVTLSSSLVDIKREVFSGCSSLEQITFPESLKTIGTNAFTGTKIKDVVLPDSLSTAGDAFNGCDYIETVTIGANSKVSANPFTNLRIKDSSGHILATISPGYFYQKDGAYLYRLDKVVKVTWISQNEDGTYSSIIYDYIMTGTTPVYKGDTPTKDETFGYVYRFNGWNVELAPIDDDTTYYAKFDNIPKTFTVTWISDGTVFQIDDVKYGSTIIQPSTKPVKEETATATYTFSKWNGFIDGIVVDGDTGFYAEFTEKLKPVDNSGKDEYLVPACIIGVAVLIFAVIGLIYIARRP